MQKIVCCLSVLIGVLVGEMFLSGAGVSYEGWFAMPETASRAVVTIATLAAFVKLFIFLSSQFFQASDNRDKDKP